MGTGLQQNLGKDWGPKVWEQMSGESPNNIFTRVMDVSVKRVERDRKRKATEKAQESRRRSKYARTDDSFAARQAYSRHDQGVVPEEISSDLPEEYLLELMRNYYNTNVVVTEEKAIEIEQETRNQAQDQQWNVERRKRVTASKVGGIVKMRTTTKRSRKVK